MRYDCNKQQIQDAMKRKLPVIHDGVQYDQIVEYGIRYDAGYAFVILRKGQQLVFAGAGELTFAEPNDPIYPVAEIERSTNESNP